MEKDLLYVVFFCSRNKDNKHLKNFKERRMSFVVNSNCIDDKLKNKFNNFVQTGLIGETSRFYMSLNPRSNQKTKKALIHYLIDHDLPLSKIESKIASLSKQKENIYKTSTYQQWLFDFDSEDTSLLQEFVEDIKLIFKERYFDGYEQIMSIVDTKKTMNGFAVIVRGGFDTRSLIDKWKDIVSLKRDGELLIDWRIK